MTGLSYPPAIWRLIITPPAGGDWNMAVDEAILESVQAGASLPALRLFAWSPPCLSIGYAQRFSDVDHDRLSSHGWEIVRRMTGGRAILHTDELTYSVIGPDHEPRLAGGVLESYRTLAQALLSALNHLQIPASEQVKSPMETSNPGEHNPVCFEVASNYEITIHGKKLIGSAQARKKAGILQHGTLPLFGDLSRIIQVLAFPGEDDRSNARASLLDRATTIESVIGKRVSWDAAVSAFVEGFKETLNLTFLESQLTVAEIERGDRLIKEKYAHPGWTERI